ncbi:hypothetical protein HG530_000919 [Fusarium avenaceum]|nr:hypothetical protein HG530_000919 [Fusarium avenaceum]
MLYNGANIIVFALALLLLLITLRLRLLSLSAFLGDHLTQVVIIRPLGSDTLLLFTLLKLAPQVVLADTVVVVKRVNVEGNIDIARLLALPRVIVGAKDRDTCSLGCLSLLEIVYSIATKEAFGTDLTFWQNSIGGSRSTRLFRVVATTLLS